jgi:hypothetical protein
MTDELKKLESRLVELDKFIASSEHAAYKSARETEISDGRSRILMTPPINEQNIATVLMSHGELDCLESMLTCFEDARVQLKQKIDEMVDRENQDAGNTKV